jgi:hypothetical protein
MTTPRDKKAKTLPDAALNRRSLKSVRSPGTLPSWLWTAALGRPRWRLWVDSRLSSERQLSARTCQSDSMGSLPVS